MNEAMIEKIKAVGVAIHRGGFSYNPIVGMFSKREVLAIWQESEDPSDEEINTMAGLVQKMLSDFGPNSKEGFKASAANTVTLKKENGKWSFRRLTWTTRPLWSEISSSLGEVGRIICN